MSRLRLEESYSFNRDVLDYIQHASEHGLYEIRGLGAKRRLPTFDDLTFLTASASRYPLEGDREKCVTKTTLGTRSTAVSAFSSQASPALRLAIMSAAAQSLTVLASSVVTSSESGASKVTQTWCFGMRPFVCTSFSSMAPVCVSQA